MKTKSLIELRETDYNILKLIGIMKVRYISRQIFRGRLSSQIINFYLNKYQRLGLVNKVSRGEYVLTDDGLYFVNVLSKLINKTI